MFLRSGTLRSKFVNRHCCFSEKKPSRLTFLSRLSLGPLRGRGGLVIHRSDCAHACHFQAEGWPMSSQRMTEDKNTVLRKSLNIFSRASFVFGQKNINAILNEVLQAF